MALGASAPSPAAGTDRAPILIVGAGQAGATAAMSLRQQGCAAPIVVCGAEAHAPYERPPLSKPVSGDGEAHDAIGIHAPALYADHSIDMRLGKAVVAIDPHRMSARCADGATLSFSTCLVATGGRARSLAALPIGTPGVHHVRTLDDARALRAGLDSPGPGPDRVLVIGGGFLGLEIASTARDAGHRVLMVETAPRLLERAVPPVFSAWLAERARATGIELRLGAVIGQLSTAVGLTRLSLAGGEHVEAAHTVVAIGLVPEVALARDAGLAIDPNDGGIVVDAQCQTSCPGIYAAGDCASQMRPFFGRQMRIESWQNANDQAQVAAAAILGRPPLPPTVPWFWTDQLGWNIQMFGAFDPALDYRLRGAPPPHGEAGKFMLLGSRNGSLRHAIAVNAGGDLRQLKGLFERHASCALDPSAIDLLCDESRPLRPLVRDLLSTLSAPGPAATATTTAPA